MIIRIFLLLMLLTQFVFAQAQISTGILPFSGIRYFNEGINCRNAEVKVDGIPITHNKIASGKDFILQLQLPTGFTEDATRKIYPAVEVTYLNASNKVLGTVANVLKDKEKTGYVGGSFKELLLPLSLQTALLKNETNISIQVRLYDLKSKKQHRLIFPVMVAPANQPTAVSKTAAAIKSSDNSQGLSHGVSFDKATISVDTSIRVAPTNAYLSIDIPGITGTSMAEVLGGKNLFWVYDKNMNEIKIADKVLKKIGGSMEGSSVNMVVKVPFKNKKDPQVGYTVRYRWESTDGKKIIDIVSTK